MTFALAPSSELFPTDFHNSTTRMSCLFIVSARFAVNSHNGAVDVQYRTVTGTCTISVAGLAELISASQTGFFSDTEGGE